MERETLIVRAVENCAVSHIANGILFLDYQHPLHQAWAKVLTPGKMPRLKAVAREIGIMVEVLSQGAKIGVLRECKEEILEALDRWRGLEK